MDPKLEEIRAKCWATPAGPWKRNGDRIESVNLTPVLAVTAVGDYGYDATVSIDFGPGCEDFIVNARDDMLKLFKLIEEINDEFREAEWGHDGARAEWEREETDLRDKITKLCEQLKQAEELNAEKGKT